MLEKMNVRFFYIDYESDVEPDIVEVTERQFLTMDGKIFYNRHTVRENGASGVFLTKDREA